VAITLTVGGRVIRMVVGVIEIPMPWYGLA